MFSNGHCCCWLPYWVHHCIVRHSMCTIVHRHMDAFECRGLDWIAARAANDDTYPSWRNDECAMLTDWNHSWEDYSYIHGYTYSRWTCRLALVAPLVRHILLNNWQCQHCVRWMDHCIDLWMHLADYTAIAIVPNCPDTIMTYMSSIEYRAMIHIRQCRVHSKQLLMDVQQMSNRWYTVCKQWSTLV